MLPRMAIGFFIAAAGIAQAQDQRCSLAEAMFVFPSNGLILTELHPSQGPLFQQFLEAIGTLRDEWGEVDLEGGNMDPSLQDFVLSKLPHKVGDGWEVYSFEDSSVKAATLKEVRLAQGEFNWRSFAGELVGVNAPESATEGRPFGVALPCGMPEAFAPMEHAQDPQRAQLALDTVISRTQQADLELIEHTLVRLPEVDQAFILGVARDEEGNKLMFLAQATNQQPAFVPFGNEGTPEGLFLIEAAPEQAPAAEAAPAEQAAGEVPSAEEAASEPVASVPNVKPVPASTYYILPDMDGNGLPEILVQTQHTYLFGITPHPGGAVTVDLAKRF